MRNETTDRELAPVSALRVEWEVTSACDLACAHCSTRPHRAGRGEASLEEALERARLLVAAGARVVALSGGEPTLRPDLPALVETLACGGVVPTLLSHGQRLTLPLAQALGHAGLGHVQLSLDGLGATHDRIRRSPGAFRGVLRAAEALRASSVPFGFTTTLLGQNLTDLEALAELVCAEGAALWQVWLGLPRHRGAQWLSPREVPGLLGRLAALGPSCPPLVLGDNLGYQAAAEQLRPRDRLEATPQDPGDEPAGFGGCEAGRRVLWLRADGRVAPCPFLDEPVLGQLGRDPLEGISARGRRALEARRAALGGACGVCAHRETCGGGCHGAALWRGGRLENPYCARVARQSETGLGRRLARAAGGAVLAATLAAGCGAPSAPRAAPAAPEARGTLRTDASVRQSVGRPALQGDAGQAALPSVPPEEKRARPSAGAPVFPRPVPHCCMMHVLVPGCRCGGPSLPSPAPSPRSRP